MQPVHFPGISVVYKYEVAKQCALLDNIGTGVFSCLYYMQAKIHGSAAVKDSGEVSGGRRHVCVCEKDTNGLYSQRGNTVAFHAWPFDVVEGVPFYLCLLPLL